MEYCTPSLEEKLRKNENLRLHKSENEKENENGGILYGQPPTANRQPPTAYGLRPKAYGIPPTFPPEP